MSASEIAYKPSPPMKLPSKLSLVRDSLSVKPF